MAVAAVVGWVVVMACIRSSVLVATLCPVWNVPTEVDVDVAVAADESVAEAPCRQSFVLVNQWKLLTNRLFSAFFRRYCKAQQQKLFWKSKSQLRYLRFLLAAVLPDDPGLRSL